MTSLFSTLTEAPARDVLNGALALVGTALLVCSAVLWLPTLGLI